MLVIGTPLATKSKSKRRKKIPQKAITGIQRHSSQVIQHREKEYSTLWQALKALPFRRGKNLILKRRPLTHQERASVFWFNLGSQGSMLVFRKIGASRDNPVI